MRLSPTPDSTDARASWLGFRLPLDIVVAPARAFAGVAATHEWLTAYALIVASGLAGLAFGSGALAHLVSVIPPPNGAAGLPAPQVADAVTATLEGTALQQLLTPLFWIGLTATVLTSIARFKGQDTSFRVYVALAANCLVPTIFGNLLSGAGVAFHPAASYHDLRAVEVAFPDSLALFADPQNTKEIAFLGQFDVFTLWSTFLLAYGFAATTPVKFNTALGTAFTLLLVLAAFSS